MALVDLVGLVGLVGLVALVSLVGKGCHVGLIFLLFDLVQKYFQMELGRSSNKGIFYGQTDHTGTATSKPYFRF